MEPGPAGITPGRGVTIRVTRQAGPVTYTVEVERFSNASNALAALTRALGGVEKRWGAQQVDAIGLVAYLPTMPGRCDRILRRGGGRRGERRGTIHMTVC